MRLGCATYPNFFITSLLINVVSLSVSEGFDSGSKGFDSAPTVIRTGTILKRKRPFTVSLWVSVPRNAVDYGADGAHGSTSLLSGMIWIHIH